MRKAIRLQNRIAFFHGVFCFKFQFVGKFFFVLFFPWRKKSTKRTPLKGVTHGASLKKPTT